MLATAAVVAAVTEVTAAEVPMGEPVRSNRRIEADRRQRRFATLAPSAHAGR